MRDLFPGWVPPDKATLEQYWEEATFAVDTSVLLDLYRFSEETRRGLINALRSFGERLWIPHQVGLEFHRNRFSVLLAQREAEDNLLNELDQIKGELNEQLGERLRGAGRRDLAPLKEAIDGGFERLREKLTEAEQAHTQGLGQSISDDPIYEEVVELFDGRIGAPFSAEEEALVIADAKERFEKKIPPGFLDAEKPGDQKYGDVILWHQLRLRAEQTGRPIVLISDDQKDDWIWEERGKTLGPRPELVAEMQENTKVGFHIYTPTRLLQIWKASEEGREVEPEVLAELEASSQDPGEGTGNLRTFLSSFVETWARGGHGEASHLVLSSTVELALRYQSLSSLEEVPGVVVTVRRGKSEQASTLIFPYSVDDSRQTFNYLVRYPDNFSQTSWAAGDYEVTWKLVKHHADQGGLPQDVARDRFTIPPNQPELLSS